MSCEENVKVWFKTEIPGAISLSEVSQEVSHDEQRLTERLVGVPSSTGHVSLSPSRWHAPGRGRAGGGELAPPWGRHPLSPLCSQTSWACAAQQDKCLLGPLP